MTRKHICAACCDQIPEQRDECPYKPREDLYQTLKEAGCTIDNHESDLYVRASPEALMLVEKSGLNYTFFSSVTDKGLWIEVPFAFSPWWEARVRR
jgi:hypothetical protein